MHYTINRKVGERIESIDYILDKTFLLVNQKRAESHSYTDKPEDISIIEIDKLFTYYKKRPKEPISGLLLSETGVKLLISK
ncbi:MAG: hypothetical protein DGJ47_000621 [Rickettsiaceae bacterium]